MKVIESGLKVTFTKIDNTLTYIAYGGIRVGEIRTGMTDGAKHKKVYVDSVYVGFHQNQKLTAEMVLQTLDTKWEENKMTTQKFQSQLLVGATFEDSNENKFMVTKTKRGFELVELFEDGDQMLLEDGDLYIFDSLEEIDEMFESNDNPIENVQYGFKQMSVKKITHTVLVSENPTHDYNLVAMYKVTDTFYIDLRKSTHPTIEQIDGFYRRHKSVKGSVNGYEVGIFTARDGQQYTIFTDHSAKKI